MNTFLSLLVLHGPHRQEAHKNMQSKPMTAEEIPEL